MSGPMQFYTDGLLHNLRTALGVQLGQSNAAISSYMARKAEELALAYGEPGYDRALEAARDAVLLYAAGEAVEAGRAFDARFKGVILGLLTALSSAAARPPT